MSATLQNNVRLRFFLVVTISLLIRVTRTQSSASVHKATGLLETNFLLYGIIVLCSLLPFKSTWIVAAVVNIVAFALDIAAISLGTLATFRCRTQTGCIKTLPMSTISLILVLAVFVLDLMQTWDIYRIIRAPDFVSSSTQRIRIIFAWALPFGWLVNIIMVTNSEWTMFKYTTAHLLVDPLIILIANNQEHMFIFAMASITMILDMFAWTLYTNTLTNKAIPIQIALTGAALLILFAGQSDEKDTEEEEETNEDFSASEAQLPQQTNIRQRKSVNKKIKF